ncbi:lactosylceramide alpha-2,3-sialyltransferase-like isoform X1 [Cololabis saira]|uniref:lactosylceramide alpha-2,3-sialyltransferase-like isoform X1 n=1 Tax=Cololabis saira TaxID=129043 RepID=UPI002AD467E4|nr:lactosylceramide alpha-2,3-sialyltransferase-like isoform X1 [Cololabis saira]XP_061582403.1 lactosylceramide alpha-2,3-sialyltransferase-like isoform X1 [Cololabis saira]
MMRFPVRRAAHRWFIVAGVALSFIIVTKFLLQRLQTETSQPVQWHVNPAHKELVHQHVRRVLEGQCRPNSARLNLLARMPAVNHATQPFLWSDKPVPDDLFTYRPPFGFKNLRGKVEDLLQLLPGSHSATLPEKTSGKCRRCVVVGNGGILKGLELGPLINRFDIIIRLNRGPLGEFSADVGNRTSIRMSYPEGTPLRWVDTDADTLFVAVVYKKIDFSWISAMINKLRVPLWDWFFFWQKVPDQVPLEPQRFRLLNPQVIRETALDLLKYPQPTQRLWGWDQNVPTLGVSALNLASLLCDEVSLAGFGYNLSQQGVPLHYYDQLPLSVMQQEKMHNVDSETQFLQSLLADGAITDLTGGIHCLFCSS